MQVVSQNSQRELIRGNSCSRSFFVQARFQVGGYVNRETHLQRRSYYEQPAP